MSEPERPLALVSNDDGHFSRGIAALQTALAAHFDVVVVAPENEQSAMSHSLSLHRPLRVRRVNEGVFAVDGTPADCVYIALNSGTRLLPRRPALVLSGVNHGTNLGQDVFYSGTVAAAREGALRKIPAIAVSAQSGTDLEKVATLAVSVALALTTVGPFAKTPLLNVNVPKEWSGDVRATHLGDRIYEQVVDFRKDPRGREYLWIGGPGVRHEPDPGSDTDAFDQGAASITPLVLDLTSGRDEPIAQAIVERVSVR